MKAFSFFEMLVALALIGILLATPNWLSLLNNSFRGFEREMEFLQLQVLLNLVEQTYNPTQAVKKLQPIGLCEKQIITIGSGGNVSPRSFNCEKKVIFISQSGHVYENY